MCSEQFVIGKAEPDRWTPRRVLDVRFGGGAPRGPVLLRHRSELKRFVVPVLRSAPAHPNDLIRRRSSRPQLQ
jgi:hypothetical protein